MSTWKNIFALLPKSLRNLVLKASNPLMIVPLVTWALTQNSFSNCKIRSFLSIILISPCLLVFNTKLAPFGPCFGAWNGRYHCGPKKPPQYTSTKFYVGTHRVKMITTSKFFANTKEIVKNYEIIHCKPLWQSKLLQALKLTMPFYIGRDLLKDFLQICLSFD